MMSDQQQPLNSAESETLPTPAAAPSSSIPPVVPAANNNKKNDTGASPLMTRAVSITPQANPFAPPTSHNGIISIIKMILVGLVLFLPRLIFTALLILIMYINALLTCYCCCDDSEKVNGTYPKYPNRRWCFRLLTRMYVRIMLFVWGYYWISVDRKEVETTPEGARTPGIVVANHTSLVEPFVIFYLEGVSALGKAEAAQAPVVGTIVSAMQFLSIDRSDPENRHNVAAEIRRRGSPDSDFPPLLIFAEGTCTNRSAIIKFKSGAFQPMQPVRCLAVDFPNWWCDVSWTSYTTLGGVFCRMMCQVFNRCHITYLGDISPPKTIEEAAKYLQQDVFTKDGMTSVRGENSNSSGGDNTLPAGSPSDNTSNKSGIVAPAVAEHMTEAFAEKVRKIFSDAMKVPLTEHSFDDVKLDYAALVLFPRSAVSLPGEMQLKVANMNYKTAKELLTEFAKFNKSRSGLLSKSEFRSFMGLEKQPDLADEIFREWAGVETNEKGKEIKGINFRNFIQQASVLKMKQIRSQVAVAVQEGADMEMARENSQEIISDVFSGTFLSMDSDRDGYVSLEEWRKGMKVVAPSLEESKLDDLFNEVDSSKDNKISLEEFVQYCEKNPHFMNYVIDVISKHDMEVDL